MAIQDFIVRIVGDSKPLSSSLAKAEADIRAFGSSATGAGQKAGAFSRLTSLAMDNVGIAAGAAFAAVAVGSVKAAVAFETAHARLTTAATDIGQNFGAVAGAVSDTDRRMVNLGFTTADTESSIAALAIPTGSVEKATQLMGVAADFARSRNISLADATSKLVRIEAGRFRGLAEIGVSSEGLTKTQAGVEEATRRVTAAVQGQAKAFASDTLAGGVAVMNAQLNDLKVQLGTALIPPAKQATGAVTDLTKALHDANTATDGWLGKLGKLSFLPSEIGRQASGLNQQVSDTFNLPTFGGGTDNASIEDLKRFIKEDKEYLAQGQHVAAWTRSLAEDEKRLAAAEKEAGAASAGKNKNIKAEVEADQKAAAAAAKHALGIYSLADAYASLGANVNNNVVGSIKNFNTAAFANFDAQHDATAAGNDFLESVQNLGKAEDSTAASTTTAAQAMFDQIGKVNALRDAQQAATDATFDLQGSQIDYNHSVVDAVVALRDYQHVLHGVNAESATAHSAADKLTRARLAAKSANLTVKEAEKALARARNDGKGPGGHGDPLEIARAEISLSQARLDAKDANASLAEAQRFYNGTLHGFAANSTEARTAQDKLRAAQDTARQSTVRLREAYDAVHDSVQDVRHAQLDLRGAFDSASAAGKKTGTTLDQVAVKAEIFGQKTAESVGRGAGNIVRGLNAEVVFLEAVSSVVPGLAHAFDDVIGGLKTEIEKIRGNQRQQGGGVPVRHTAAGGSLKTGEMSWVGEHGPELFRAGTSGRVIPNNQIGGGAPVYVVVHVDPMTGANTVKLLRNYQTTNGPIPIKVA